MIIAMLTFKSKKSGLRKQNRNRLNPLVDQVKKLMESEDQGLILMVRN